MYHVYLAGPVTNCTYKGCTDWRDYVSKKLNSMDTICLSPMRAKKFLFKHTKMSKSGYDFHPLTTKKGVLARDKNDCLRADVLFVNFLDAVEISIGTCIEIAWTHLKHTPVVCIMKNDNIHMNHAMLDEMIDFIVEDLDSAIEITKTILK